MRGYVNSIPDVAVGDRNVYGFGTADKMMSVETRGGECLLNSRIHLFTLR
jgi:hypothetical protein